MSSFRKLELWPGLTEVNASGFSAGRTLHPEKADPAIARAMKGSGLDLRCHVNKLPGVNTSPDFHRFLQGRFYYQLSGETKWIFPEEEIYDYSQERTFCSEWIFRPGKTKMITQNPGELWQLPLGLVHKREPGPGSSCIVFLKEEVLLRDLYDLFVHEFYRDHEGNSLDLLPPDFRPELIKSPGWEERITNAYEYIRLKKYGTPLSPED